MHNGSILGVLIFGGVGGEGYSLVGGVGGEGYLLVGQVQSHAQVRRYRVGTPIDRQCEANP